MSASYDLILVGTGFASSFFLYKYLQRFPQSQRILVLERGGVYPHTRQLADMRQKGQTRGPDPMALIESTPSSKPWQFSSMYGGSSNCWWGCVPRFLPADFELFSRYGVGTDWPIGYEDLAPYYAEAEQLMQVSGPDLTPFPLHSPYPQPPHRLNPLDRLLQERFGTDYIAQPTARSSTGGAGRGLCCNNAVCSLCPLDAKFTIENGLAPSYAHPAVELQTQAQVLRLESTNDRVQSLVYRQNGQEHQVFGQLFGLGANAIFNAHILLQSGDQQAWLGHGLSEQLSVTVDLHLKGLQNTGASTVISANGYMLYDGPHRAERGAVLLESHNTPDMVRTESGRWLEVARFKCIIEDLPQKENRVQLHPRSEIPALRFARYTDYALNSQKALPELLEQLFAGLPVERMIISPEPSPTEGHILGTHRMSRAAAEGVTDHQMMHHRWRNLLVLGGGSFPTISPSNPTLTLSALSLRAADLL